MQAQLCNAVVRLKLELYRLPAGVHSAVVLDGYNALFWRSEMFAPERLRTPRPARRLAAQELTLGANLRALDDAATGGTAVLAAACASGSVPLLPKASRPEGSHCAITLPLLSLPELATMLQWYRCATGHPCMHAARAHPLCVPGEMTLHAWRAGMWRRSLRCRLSLRPACRPHTN
jgi:hypothetical protein